MAKTATGMKEAAIALHARLVDASADVVIADCHAFWQTWGTLPAKPVDLAGLRRAALRTKRAEGRRQGVEIGFIARGLNLSPNRFSRLTAAEEAAA